MSPGPLWTVSETDTFVTSSLKMRQESAQWREALEKHRFIRGAEVLWQRGADPSAAELAREAVLEFRSAADAAAFDEWDANRSCRTIAVFAVPPISNAIGYRFDADGEDRAIEEVSFLAGNRIYSVLLNTSSAAPVRQELMALVGRAVFRASSSGPGCDRLPGMVEDARFWATRRMPPDISPRKLAQIRPPSGFLAGQESRAPSPNPIDPSRPGPGWFRSWEDGPSQIRLNVFRFATTDASLQWVSGAAVLRCRETVPTVSTDYDVPGSIVMVRLSPSNIVKDVFIVRGRVGYMVDFLGPVSEDPRSLLRPFLLRLEARNTQT